MPGTVLFSSSISSGLIASVFVCFQAHALAESHTGRPPELPDICAVITAEDITQLNPFLNPLSKLFPDANNHESYSGCHYQFYKPDDFPGITVRLIKWSSKQEAVEDFRMQERRASEWPKPPEPISGVADLAFFNYDNEDSLRCDECYLAAVRKEYGMTISFKGQFEKVPRSKKRDASLKILKLLRDRIAELK